MISLHNHDKILHLKIFDLYIPSLARRVCCRRTSRDTQRWPQEPTVRRMTMIWNRTLFLSFGFLWTLYLSLVSNEGETVRKKLLETREISSKERRKSFSPEGKEWRASALVSAFYIRREERGEVQELWTVRRFLSDSLISDTLSWLCQGNDTNRLDRESIERFEREVIENVLQE